MKKLVLTVALLSCLGLIWQMWPIGEGDTTRSRVAADSAAEAAEESADPPSFPATAEDRIALDSAADWPRSDVAVDATGSLVVHVRWGDDGADAAGVGFILRPSTESRTGSSSESGSTSIWARSRASRRALSRSRSRARRNSHSSPPWSVPRISRSRASCGRAGGSSSRRSVFALRW